MPVPPPEPANPAFVVHPLALLRVLRTSGSALLTQAGLHGQLLRLEWAQEQQRLGAMLLTSLLGFACLLATLLLLAMLVLLLSWQTPWRLPAVLGLLGVFGLGTGLAGWHWRQLARRGSTTFAASRAELSADLALLKSKL